MLLPDAAWGKLGSNTRGPFRPRRPKGSPRLWEIRGKANSRLPSPRAEHFAVLIIACRADNIADDGPRSCHPSQPALLLGLWRRRYNFSHRFPEPRHAAWFAGLADALEVGETPRFELRDGNLFHAKYPFSSHLHRSP